MSYPGQHQQGQGGDPYGQYPGYGPYAAYPQPVAQPGNGLAIASLVCGIVGLLIFWIVLSPLAVIFGGVGLSKANNGAKHKGLAIAGLVLGIVGIVGYIILLATVFENGRYVV